MKTFFKNWVLFFAAITAVNMTYAQYGQVVNEIYYSDSASGYLDYIHEHIKVDDGLIVSGFVKQNDMEVPVIIRLNTAGEIIWSTLENFNFEMYGCFYFEIALFEDGYIYGSPGTSGNNSLSYIWKVDAQTGAVLYNTPLFQNEMDNPDFIDLDSTRFAIATKKEFPGSRISIMEKETGNVITYRNMTGSNSRSQIELDANGNIYFAVSGTLRKFNGDDLDQEIWSSQMPVNSGYSINDIHKLYLDQFDDLYAVGHTQDTYDDEFIIKINTHTGDTIWTTNLNTSYRLVDFKDMGESLLVLLEKTTTSNGLMRIRKINKSTGETELNVNHYITDYLDEIGGENAGESIDFDCNGNIFLTGHVGGWQNGNWIVAKIDGEEGSWEYHDIITLDTTEFDSKSTGVATAVFDNQPVFLGLQEEIGDTLPGNYDVMVAPTYVAMDPNSGQITAKKFLGSKYLHPSRTIDLVNVADTVYALKQVGSRVAVEQYDNAGNLLWHQDFSDGNMLKAGQMKIIAEKLIFTAYRLADDTTTPFYSSQTEYLFGYEMNRSDGALLATDTVTFGEEEVVPFELEADSAAAYVFYQRNANNYYRKWDTAGFSAEHFLEPSGSNLGYDGEINTVFDAGENLIAIGTDSIYSIDKTTLFKSPVTAFEQPRDYYFNLSRADTLFLCGNSPGSEQVITALDISDFSPIWEQTYAPNGTIYKLGEGTDNTLLAMGTEGNQILIQQLQSNDGQMLWSYNDVESTTASTPYDIKFIPHEEDPYLVYTGAVNISPTASDLIVRKLSLGGDTLYAFTGHDELDGFSRGSTIALADSLVWIGGSYNKVSVSKAGFIFIIDHQLINTSISDLDVSSDQIHAYPNPTHDFVRVEGMLPGFSYQIFDTKGALQVVESNSTTNTIDLSHLPQGFYFIRLSDDVHNETIKVIKQ